MNRARLITDKDGIGAVVESANGLQRWVRSEDGAWRDAFGTVLHFDKDGTTWPPRTTVLSHGYRCTCGADDCPGGDS